MTMSRARVGRFALLVMIAAGVALVATSLFVRGARAEAPAHWRPLLMSHPNDVRTAPRLETGSAGDRAELDEIIANQAHAARLTEQISYWTTGPTPARWNEILLAAVRKAKTNPVRVSRTLALLNAAMYDAVIAACDSKIAYRRSSPTQRDSRIKALATPDELSSHASVDAAIAGAAVTVLGTIYPDRAADFQERADELITVRLTTGTHTRSDIDAGTQIGLAIGALAVARARSDGADAIWQGEVPTEPGNWQPAKPFRNDQPTEPLAGTWKPWLMATGSDLRPGPPPAYKSAEWQAEADEIIRVAWQLTDEQVRIARFWADGAGTDTPPGHWMRIAIALAARDHLPLQDAARLFAHLAMAQADAFISCWDAKYFYWSGRPTGLIPGFASTIITPNFPSYTSGHSTLSGASSVVLSAFFAPDAASLTMQAEEAAVSRLYGGIHWASDNNVGLGVGRRIGDLAVARAARDGGLR
jgi:membrane-associated phospholipid phosphatase